MGDRDIFDLNLSIEFQCRYSKGGIFDLCVCIGMHFR